MRHTPNPAMPERPRESMLALLAAALREGGTLVGGTLALARTEIDGNLRAILGLLALAGTIVVLLVAAFFVLLDALVKALAVLLGSEPVAALVVAAPFLLAAGWLGWIGLGRIARATTIRRRDALTRSRAPGSAQG